VADVQKFVRDNTGPNAPSRNDMPAILQDQKFALADLIRIREEAKRRYKGSNLARAAMDLILASPSTLQEATDVIDYVIAAPYRDEALKTFVKFATAADIHRLKKVGSRRVKNAIRRLERDGS
jgi:hypothetical protein